MLVLDRLPSWFNMSAPILKLADVWLKPTKTPLCGTLKINFMTMLVACCKMFSISFHLYIHLQWSCQYFKIEFKVENLTVEAAKYLGGLNKIISVAHGTDKHKWKHSTKAPFWGELSDAQMFWFVNQSSI